MKTYTQFAVIDRDGFFRDTTKVYSAHATEAAAVKAAKRHKVSMPGNGPNQFSAMVIRCDGGFSKGGVITRNKLLPPDPIGPDNGYAAVESGEGVITRAALKHYGPGIIGAINKLMVPKAALKKR